MDFIPGAPVGAWIFRLIPTHLTAAGQAPEKNKRSLLTSPFLFPHSVFGPVYFIPYHSPGILFQPAQLPAP
jgi:hypothetical protein